MLLSSFFMYNSMRTIDENAIQDLSLVGKLTELVRMRAGGAPPSRQELQARPSLIPPDARTPRRAGIEWRHCHRAVCMARPHKEPHHSGQAEP